MKHFSFERDIIDKILNTIKKHQVYLTQPENLPQLAKLGYMYNTLWYAGRICWGYDGIIKRIGKYGNCEDNPKYKIEMCEPENEEIENLIYDAWGMHVDDMQESWETFYKNVMVGKVLSDYELALRKPNKTFDEWVAVLTNKEYQYSRLYPNRRSVADHLLCVIGNGYGYKNGFIIQEASGADQDVDLYGHWENAVFSDEIGSIVESIMNNEKVKQTIQTAHEYIKEAKRKREEKDRVMIGGKTISQYMEELEEKMKKMKIEEPDKFKQLVEKHPQLYGEFDDEYVEPYNPYYPICEYSEITKFDENTHPSYIKAGIEICEEIIEHEVEESARPENVSFAKEFLTKFKK